MKDRLLHLFNSNYENPSVYVDSPGRANIIGEHTDYNHGLVLPFAINKSIKMIIGKNKKGMLRIYANDLNDKLELNISDLKFSSHGWSRYFINSLVAIQYDEKWGIDVCFGGNLPQGGGVSSSSAITCGFLSGVNALLNLGYTIDQMIDLASQAENGIGLNGGIMDQTSIFKGKKDNALLIDFLDQSISEITLPTSKYKFYLFNSGQKHNLVETEYNIRRTTCETALQLIKAQLPQVQTFRDLTKSVLESFVSDPKMKKRCTHVIEENQRVLAMVSALQKEDDIMIGDLLNAGHQSLSSLYEVSTPEIDFLVDESRKIESVLGSRLMGGGFGGCTINFATKSLLNHEIENLKEKYFSQTGLRLNAFEIKAEDGVLVSHLNG